MDEEKPQIKMGKVVVSKTSCVLSLVILILMCACVALLVFVLKGEKYSESLELEDHQDLPDFQADEPPLEPPKEIDLWQHFRLPPYIVPMHYDLLMRPNLTTDLFTGKANITVDVSQKTKYFIVHANRLNVLETRLFNIKGGSEIAIEKSFMYPRYQYFVVETNDTVDSGIYRLYFEFQGSLAEKIIGFYKSSYKDGNETRYLATTKFEPTYARQAFPCFDEPNFKTTFSIALVHENGYTAVSNMPVETTKSYDTGSLLLTKFQKSVPMTTYLACFIVCDFRYQETTTSKGKPFRVYSSPGLVNTTSFAVQTGSDVLNFFEDYFGIDYPLPKQDMIAIPDFPSYAMENWGLITFREEALLYDAENSSPSYQQRVATVIAHEMAHMWFGNLVTLKWWNDLWLNEGFASYIEYKGVDATHPDWDILSQFLIEDLQAVMDIDATMSSHPIVKKVLNTTYISSLFDKISYKKGASVLRMLEFFMGSDKFRIGISKYLKKYKYQNAATPDLWEELSETAGYQGGRNISSIMKLWTDQLGFPCINVTRKGQNSSTFTFKQKRFLKESTSSDTESDKDIWSVPISYITSDGVSGIFWLHDKEGELVLPVDDSKWVKFNINQTGYYIINYEEKEWKRLAELLLTNHEELTPSDRSNLLFDSYQLTEAGFLDMGTFLSMSKYLKNEAHYVPWKTANIVFEKILKLMHTDVEFMFKGFLRELTNELYDSLKWEVSGNHLDSLLRSVIINLACQTENKACLSHAYDLYQDWVSGQRIPPAVRSLMLKFGIAGKGLVEWNHLWEKYLIEQSPSQKSDYAEALSSVTKPRIIQKYLEYSMDEEKVRRQDFFTTLHQIARNPVGKTLAFNFFRDKWTKLVEKFTSDNRNLGFAFSEMCTYFSTESELKQVRDFFRQHPDARILSHVIEVIDNNIIWVKTHINSVKTWLQNEGPQIWYHYQLPTYIIPQHYDLTFFPMLDQDIFNGSVSISVVLKQPSNCFVLHSVGLEVSKVEVQDLKSERLVQLEDVFPFVEHDYLVVKLKEKLSLGSYKLYLEFQGPLTLSLRGLYKSSYVDPANKEIRYLATTQFEATEARRAFPCFDEPRYKATFQVSVIHDSSHYALSNTMVENTTELENGLLLTVFENTPPMVTYLLSIAVCDFKFKETFTDSGVRIRVYAAPHHYDNIDYSLKLGKKVLTFYESYFGIAFPLKKLDMIAVPDFRANGMENWGLISFSERSLVTRNPPSLTARTHISAIMAHELAHMWFGDLVSLAWWDDLWLNEGFATYMSQKGVQNAEPDLDEENFEGISRLLIAMRNDQTVNAHAIVPTVTSASTELFDAITYSKGSTVLRMLENYMGQDFREGVSDYLKKYSFDYAKTENLWEKLSENSRQGLNVSVLMNTWTTQPNYPYVSIRRDTLHEDFYIVQQHHFLRILESNDLIYNVSPEKYVWQLPLSYYTSHTNKVSYILLNSTEEVRLHVSNSKWIKFNAGLAGYYSVNYEEKMWEEFISLLQTNHSAISASDRINLVFDAFSLASAGLLSYDIPLNLTRYVKTETYYGAWSVVLQELQRIKRLFREVPGEIQDIIEEYIRTLSKDLLQGYSWNDTGSYVERMLRNTLIEAVCENGGKHCLQTALHLFKEWMNGKDLDVDIREVVYTYGLRADENEESWNYVWEKYLQENDLYERERLRNALTKVQNSTFIERLINYSCNETVVRKHEYFAVLQQIALNSRVGFILITHRIFTEWNDLLEMHGDLRSIIFSSELFSLFTTEEELKKVEEFYEMNDKSNMALRARTRATDSITLNINWLKRHKRTVQNWFQSTVYMPWKQSRLPDHILPLKYTLNLHPNLTQSTTEGEVTIELNITQPTDYLVLHAKKLVIEETELKESGRLVPTDEEFLYKKNEFFVILLKERVQPGIFVLRIKFHGSFSFNGEGIGLFEYNPNGTNEARYLAATRFQGTYARKVFPCFDEPNKKARFQINVKHEANYNAVSNMPVKDTEILQNGMVNTAFEESVPMSTYLLFLLVSDFGYLEENYNGKPIRVYAPKDQLSQAMSGLNVTVKILKELEEYFKVTYALPKLDSVAIPNYGASGMEHWGVITYNAERFLVPENMTTYKRIVDIERVISHELAHQWIGNLVTTDWWDDIWLSEGITTLIQYIPLKKSYPSINQVDVTKKARMICIDSKTDSHPLVRKISSSKEINEAFDSITYEKGAAIIQMLQYILKEDFRTGLTNFLQEYSFKTAKSENLWTEMISSTNKEFDLPNMMYTWTNQMGFPYIDIKRDGDVVSATQQWLLRNTNSSNIDEEIKKHPSPSGYVWEVPLAYKNLNSKEEDILWLKTKQDTFVINGTEHDVLKFNPDFTGFYVVNYDPKDWAKLGQRLLQNHEDFSVADRYNILHDAFILAESGRLSYEIPLQLTKYLTREKESSIWNFFRDQYLYLMRRLDYNSEARKLLKEYTRKLTAELYDDYVYALPTKKLFKKWNSLPSGCSFTDMELDFISVIIDLACSTSHMKCVNLMEQELHKWLQGEKILSDPKFVLEIAIPHFGNDTLWDFMYNALKSNDSKQTLVYLEGLTRFSNPDLIQKTLEFITFDPSLNKDLAIYMVYELSKNPVAFLHLWDFTRFNLTAVSKRLNDENHVLTSLALFCENLNAGMHFFEMDHLLNTSPELSKIQDVVKEGCKSRILSNIEWNKKFKDIIATWLLWNTSS